MIEDMDTFSYALPTINSSLSILVVDDSSLNRKLLCKLLCAAGYTCEEASDGLIAVEMVRRRMSDWAGPREEYRAILMDFVMPNMDGPTATKEIRDLGYRGPIFGVTGNAMNSDVNYFVGSGADGVLAKPFDFSMFKELLSLETA
jgi:CheY-like chemotaxis protein